MDLFSGIGGFALAASRVWGAEHEIVTFCEKEEFPRQVLRKHWPDVPCVEDIHDLKGYDYGAIDLITGGFPCQPFSVAGKQSGAKDDRALWPEMYRVIKEAKPRIIVGENVANFQNMELDSALSDLESEGYEVGALNIPACGVEAPQPRQRIWILAYSKSLNGKSLRQGIRREKSFGIRTRWIPEPRILRVVDGLSGGLDKRNKALGNAIVPQVAAVIMLAIKEVDRVL